MKPKIFFLGTPEIAVPSLLTLNDTAEIVGVGVFPDRKVGRKKILTPCPVKAQAIELNLPIYEIDSKKELINIYEQIEFDIGIVIAFGMIIPEKVLEDHSFYNIHFSLLPKWRGASPVQSSILAGETLMGITCQGMVYQLDAGDIAWQKSFEMKGRNTAEVWEFLAEETAKELSTFVNNLGNITTVPQVESEATFCSKFEKSDGEIDFAQETAKDIYQKFLAFDPWPGIYVNTTKGNVKLIDISLDKTNESIGIETKDRTIYVNKIQIPGKKPTPIKDILKGIPDLFEKK